MAASGATRGGRGGRGGAGGGTRWAGRVSIGGDEGPLQALQAALCAAAGGGHFLEVCVGVAWGEEAGPSTPPLLTSTSAVLSLRYTEITRCVPQKVLTSSRKVDECQPRYGGHGGGDRAGGAGGDGGGASTKHLFPLAWQMFCSPRHRMPFNSIYEGPK